MAGGCGRRDVESLACDGAWLAILRREGLGRREKEKMGGAGGDRRGRPTGEVDRREIGVADRADIPESKTGLDGRLIGVAGWALMRLDVGE